MTVDDTFWENEINHFSPAENSQTCNFKATRIACHNFSNMFRFPLFSSHIRCFNLKKQFLSNVFLKQFSVVWFSLAFLPFNIIYSCFFIHSKASEFALWWNNNKLNEFSILDWQAAAVEPTNNLFRTNNNNLHKSEKYSSFVSPVSCAMRKKFELHEENETPDVVDVDDNRINLHHHADICRSQSNRILLHESAVGCNWIYVSNKSL